MDYFFTQLLFSLVTYIICDKISESDTLLFCNFKMGVKNFFMKRLPFCKLKKKKYRKS